MKIYGVVTYAAPVPGRMALLFVKDDSGHTHDFFAKEGDFSKGDRVEIKLKKKRFA